MDNKIIKEIQDKDGYLYVNKINKIGLIENDKYENLYLAQYKNHYLIVQSIGNDQVLLLGIVNND